MTSMLREVVLHGTGIAAAKLPFPVAGKTGHHERLYRCMVRGFLSDSNLWSLGRLRREKKSLGAKETGAHAALPIWMNFMSGAMAGKDMGDFRRPPTSRMP